MRKVSKMAYNPTKAAQTIAFFSLKNGGRPVNTLKAVKLVYFADRESVRQYGYPIQDEPRVSVPHGPVNSMTYNFIKGEVRDDDGWSTFVTDREGHNIGLADPSISLDDLDELSDADLSVLEHVWESFGHMNQWEVRDLSHDSRVVPEWNDPQGSSLPIDLESMMAAVECANHAEAAQEYRSLHAASDFLRKL